MVWTLCYNETEKPLPQWGIGNLTRRTLNQGIDTVRFECLGPSVEKTALFLPEHTLTLRYQGKNWFRGLITQTPVFGKANGEGRNYVVAGPWWY
ncbi:MAG: hypothetical protein LBR62_02425, partial [Puniceicoccales bacterium]|nr:hypothetical protein [Puniceicoccales bacterium]